jgi:hypothetical protein
VVHKEVAVPFASTSWYFDGSGDRVTITTKDSSYLVAAADHFTISFWVRYSSLPTTGNQVTLYVDEFGTALYLKRLPDNSLVYELTYGGPIGNTSSPPSQTITLDTWYFIEVCRRPYYGTKKTDVYVNGDFVGTYVAGDGSMNIGNPIGNTLYVGGDTTAANSLHGYMSHVVVLHDVAWRDQDGNSSIGIPSGYTYSLSGWELRTPFLMDSTGQITHNAGGYPSAEMTVSDRIAYRLKDRPMMILKGVVLDVNGSPAQRDVVVFSREDPRLLRSVRSLVDGAWEVSVPSGEYVCVAFDEGVNPFNAIVYDRVEV